MFKRIMLCVVSVVASVAAADDYAASSDQEVLESILWDLANPPDNLTDEMIDAEVPPRYRDAIPSFKRLIEGRGWTTNQLIEGLYMTFSNNFDRVVFDANEYAMNFYHPWRLSAVALYTIGEINHPLALEIIKETCTNEHFYGDIGCPGGTLIGVFRYSDFGPETMQYMYDLCVRTNMYARAARTVTTDMVQCVLDVTNAYRDVAITNVARFIYFSMRNSPGNQLSQDWDLSEMLSGYSNSLARIHAFTHILATTTNEHERTWIQNELASLNALPPEELNDMTWLENAIIESYGEPSMQSYSMESQSDNDGATEGYDKSHLVSSVVQHIRDFFAAIWEWLCGLFV